MTKLPTDADLWKAWLFLDPILLAPPRRAEGSDGDDEAFLPAIRRRIHLLLGGKDEELVAELSWRKPPRSAPPDLTDEERSVEQAKRAERKLRHYHSVSAAAAALRAPVQAKPTNQSTLTATLQRLNPQVGDPAPPPPAFLVAGGGDRPDHRTDAAVPTRSLPTARRINPPPPDAIPTPIQFTTAQVLARSGLPTPLRPEDRPAIRITLSASFSMRMTYRRRTS